MNFAYGAPAYPEPGDVIEEKYEIVRTLGVGGMGAVALATHRLLRSPVALKFIAPHVLMAPGAIERFLNEALAARKIKSAHVVDVFDVGRLPSGAPYIVMEYLEGRDLAQVLAEDGAPGLPVARAIHLTLQILRALEAAHAGGIVHRDVKPSNCLVIRHDGEDDFVKVVDFGISKVDLAGAPALTRTNSALGTPLYMSPEQAKSARSVDARSDLYSAGAILYECLAGRTPHVAESGELTEILYKLFTAEPEPILSFRPDLPAGLAAVVHRALARERDDRPASAAELAELLAPFADERSAPLVARLRPPASRLARTARLPSIPPGAQPVAHSRSVPPSSTLPLPGAGPSAPPPAPRPPSPAATTPRSDATGSAPMNDAIFARGAAATPAAPYRTDMAAAREPSRGAARGGRRSALWLAVPALAVVGVVTGAGWLLTRPRPHADIGPSDTATATTARGAPLDAEAAGAPPEAESARAAATTSAPAASARTPMTPSASQPAVPSARPPERPAPPHLGGLKPH